MTTKLIHFFKGKSQEYIGRPRGNAQFHFGNPFSHKADSKAMIVLDSNVDAVDTFRKWMAGEVYQDVEPERRKWIVDNIDKLHGKVIACWCAPKPCHGQVYLEMIQKKHGGEFVSPFELENK